MTVFGAIGFLGVGFYLGSYAMLQLGILRSDRFTYIIMNLLAPMCVAVSLIEAFNLSSLITQVCWISVSIVGITRLFLRSRNRRLTFAERRFADLMLPDLAEADLKELLRIGVWKDVSPSERITTQGQPVHMLAFLSSGSVEVQKSGETVVIMDRRAFVGEMSCLSGRPASATVTALSEVRTLMFPVDALRALVDRSPTIRSHLQGSFARDLCFKLEETSQHCLRVATERAAPRAA